MAFDLGELGRMVRRHGRIARVLIAETSGSVPREAGRPCCLNGRPVRTIGGARWSLSAGAAAREHGAG